MNLSTPCSEGASAVFSSHLHLSCKDDVAGMRGPVAPKVVDVGAPTRLVAAIKASETVSKLISFSARVYLTI